MIITKKLLEQLEFNIGSIDFFEKNKLWGLDSESIKPTDMYFSFLVLKRLNEISNIELDSGGNVIYYETTNGYWKKTEYNEDGLEVYYEKSTGYWCRIDYKDGEVYVKDSIGYWCRSKYEDGLMVYEEDSDGRIEKIQYNEEGLQISLYSTCSWDEDEFYWSKTEYENGKETYFKNSDGYWKKTTYNEEGLEVYLEDSDGFWRKTEYKGLVVFSEDKNGEWKKKEFYTNGQLKRDESKNGIILEIPFIEV